MEFNKYAIKDLNNRLLYAAFVLFVGLACLLASSLSTLVAATFCLACIIYEILFYTPRGFYVLKFISSTICLFGIFLFVVYRFIFGVEVCLFLICIASGADIGGYFFGKFFGKTKLCPTISPNKTVEGLFGSVLFSNVLAVICNCYFDLSVSFLATQFILIFAILGDLFESKIKRMLDIKDFGHCLGDHGGMFDRFDSLVFASISFCAICVIGRFL